MSTEPQLKLIEDPLGVSLETSATDAVILPERLDEASVIGIYRDEVLSLKKDLVAVGLSADFLYPTDNRRWLGLHGEVVVSIVVGLFTSGAVAALQVWIVQKFGQDKVRARVARVRKTEAGTSEVLWYEVEGSATGVAAALEPLRRDDYEDS